MERSNHHAGKGGFSGVTGALIGLSLLVGRGHDARLACDLAAVGPADEVVDVGCGPGVAARAAALRGAHVLGVDPARPMLALARRFRRSGVDYVVGAAESLPIAGGSSTVVWSLATAHHWVDVDRGLAEARRVLGAGGRLLVLERTIKEGARGHASHGWTASHAASFAAACERAGFTGVTVTEHRGRRGALVAVSGRAPDGGGS
jgi:ubiquinone/menaquinone biosynthesis C-methylase UbiE